jgi:glycine cleavage system H protein
MSDESYPDELHYHEAHDWVRVDGDIATFGITWYAQDTLGEVVFYSPPEVGDTITKDADYGELESTKAVSGLVAPLSGEIVEVNESLDGNESTINDDPYGEGWLVKVRMSDTSEVDALMDAGAQEQELAAGVGVSRRELGEVGHELRLGQGRLDVQLAIEPDRLGDVPEELLDRSDADGGEHRIAVGIRERGERHRDSTSSR